MSDRPRDGGSAPSGDTAHQVRLPGFIVSEPVGLGDLIKRATSMAGVAPCGSCAERMRTLNRWLQFTPRRP